MKTLIILSILFLSCVLSAQTDTTLTSADYTELVSRHNAWRYLFRTDTIDATSDPDTVNITFPQVHSGAYSGIFDINQDTLLGGALVGTVILRESGCSTCPYVDISGGSITPSTDPDSTLSANFYLRHTLMKAEIICTDGKGFINMNMTLKPSAINN